MKRPGGRTQKTRDAVLAAAYGVVSDLGYDGLTVEAIADRAGVHKTTIYRRWNTADDVLFDAVVAQAEDAIPFSRTEDARADLVAMGKSVAANLVDPMSRAVAAAILSGAPNDRLAELNDRFWTLRIAGAAQIVEAAQDQGAVNPALNPANVVERIVGPIWFRSMTLRQAVDDTYVENLVSTLT